MMGGRHSQGFTIIEVMIVMAVSGAILASTLILMNGRQNKAEFFSGMRNLTINLQGVINNVSNGYYNSQQNFTCVATPNGPQISATTKPRGTNLGCTYIGEVLQFSSAADKYTVYPVAGLQYQYVLGSTSTAEVTNLAEAMPTALSPDSAAPAGSVRRDNSIHETQQVVLPFGISVVSVTWSNGKIKHPVGAIGFFTTFATYGNSGTVGGLNNGSRNVQIIPIPNSSLNDTKLTEVNNINSLSSSGNTVYGYAGATSQKDPIGGIKICFNSGSTNESGLITIGSLNSPTDVTLHIFSAKGCV
jgi:prepilin-type N-terminal cleavage/methylation domain-containing protein